MLKFKMFKEIEGEFDKNEYPAEKKFLIDGEEKNGNYEYDFEIDYPYGTYEMEVMWDMKGKTTEEESDLKQLPDSEKKFLNFSQDPEPISMEQLAEMHALEEEENKKREQEARLAQKRLEEEKSRLRYEQQQQIAKQEQNTAQLKVYFEAMNLGFHTGEEDFNASMSVLSIYHQDLMDNFRFYSSLQEQKFRKEENTMITLQGFVHFLKVMKIAESRDECSTSTECMHEIDGVITPFTDTLNIFNGLNYAQFLEAILRIAYHKKDNSDQAGNHDGFKNTLEAMFSDADLDIRKRAKEDETMGNFLELAQQGFLEDNFDLLAAVFNDKGMLHQDHFELSKAEFIGILKDCDLLIK